MDKKEYTESLSTSTYNVSLMANAIKIEHYCGSYKKSTIQATRQIDIDRVTEKEIKKLFIEGKKTILEDKKYLTLLHGCTKDIKF
jgi:hypothetical protein